MNCRKCKKEIPEGSNYCNHCGVKQNIETKQRSRANGTGTVFKRGKTWTAQTTIGYKPNKDGTMRAIRTTKGGYKTKTAALEALPQLKANGKPNTSIVTIDSLWQGYSTSAMTKLSASKQGHYRTARKKLEDIAYINIKLLTIDDLQDIVDEVAPTYYPAKDIKVLLTHIYDRAVAQQIIHSNLAEYITLPQLNEKPSTPFSEDEIITLWDNWENGDPICGFALLMIYTGMMPGELNALQTDMINFNSKTIVGCGLKTKVRKETPIILPDIIIPVVDNLCKNAQNNKILPYRRDDFCAEFKKMVERYGLNPDLKPYSCRHTTGTTLAQTDTPLFTIKGIMRHSKITTTQRYVHIDSAPLIEAANTAYAPKRPQKQEAKN